MARWSDLFVAVSLACLSSCACARAVGGGDGGFADDPVSPDPRTPNPCTSGNCTVPFFSQVTLLCPSAGPNFSWFRVEGKSYTHLGHCSGANCTLLHVLAPDSGEYICHDPLIGSSAFSNNTSCTVRLIVLAPPVLSMLQGCQCHDTSKDQHFLPVKCQQMSSQTVLVDKPLTLYVTYKGAGDSMTVSWLKNGKAYNCSADPHCTGETTPYQDFLVNTITMNDPKSSYAVENYSGHYTANVSSEYGWNTSYIDSVKFEVCKQESPITVGGDLTVALKPDATQSFQCPLVSKNIKNGFTLGVCLLGPNQTLADVNTTEYCSFCNKIGGNKCSPLKARPNWDIQRYNEPTSPEKCPVGGVNVTIREADQSDAESGNVSCFYNDETDSKIFYKRVSLTWEGEEAQPIDWELWGSVAGVGSLVVLGLCVSLLVIVTVSVRLRRNRANLRRARQENARLESARLESTAKRRELRRERREKRMQNTNSLTKSYTLPSGEEVSSEECSATITIGTFDTPPQARLLRSEGPNPTSSNTGYATGHESEPFLSEMDPDFELPSNPNEEANV